MRDDPGGMPKILGYDAAGVIVETGSDARLFRHGDAVFYAGAVGRQGANAEFQLADERLVGRKPGAFSFAEAAALPLTSLTAWELMFERIGIRRGADADRWTLLIVGGAGGVGSDRDPACAPPNWTDGDRDGFAARNAWCDSLGAAHVIDHFQPLQPQIEALGLRSVDIILSLTASERHPPELAKILAPQGISASSTTPRGSISVRSGRRVRPPTSNSCFRGRPTALQTSSSSTGSSTRSPIWSTPGLCARR